MGAAGSDVALETADVALMADNLAHLPFAVGLSRHTCAIIPQNVFVSLGVVALLVPATILGLGIGPAVAMHEGSTLLADVGRAPAATDYHECREALAWRAALRLEGWMAVLGSGEPVAFLLAGPEVAGTRIVHFAKGRRAHAGAYPWLFAQFAAVCGAARLNFEQDLGNPGFAQAKRALAPAGQLRKYRLWPAGGA